MSFVLFYARGIAFIRDRDDMHLGPEAMKMIGKGIAKDIVESGVRLEGLKL